MHKRALLAGLLAFSSIPGLAIAQETITSDLDASIRFGLGLNTEPESDLSFRNFGSRVRWAGSAEIDDSTRIISYLEFGFDQDAGVARTRHAWVGVSGDFGSITGGKQYSAFYDAVTSKVDVAYWRSCVFEAGCSRQSAMVKYAMQDTGDLQLIGSATLREGNPELTNDDELIDGLDLAAKISSGEFEIGAGISYLGDRFDEDGNAFDSGFALGVSASTDIGDSNASATVQVASDDYAGSEDTAVLITTTYSSSNIYGVFGIADADITPFYLTGGYVKPLIQDRALAYFELSLVDTDQAGTDTDLQGRAVLVFNFGRHSGG